MAICFGIFQANELTRDDFKGAKVSILTSLCSCIAARIENGS